jgi:hypothetical protein
MSTEHRSLVQPGQETPDEQGPGISMNEETQFLITFSPPDNPTTEEKKLTADIVILDHRANHQLKPKTREWDEVVKLLINAVVFLQSRDSSRGRLILEEAERVYFHHNQTRNRIRYLSGAVVGIIVAALLGTAVLLVSKSIHQQFVSPWLLVLLFIFAGMGSVTSILTRISSIDLKKETSYFSVYLSGFSKPVVAIFLAVVVYLILTLKIVDIRFGNPPDSWANGIYLVTSFLCGFSERFAKDIISRVSFGGTNSSEQVPQ